MQVPFVMTVIGKDRPGIVRSLAENVAAHGGNWLDSRMARLGGHFAGILRVEIPRDQQILFLKSLQQLETGGLKIVAAEGQGEEAKLQEFQAAELSIVGQDRPGIVHQITQALAQNGVNVEELKTECVSAAMSGENLFQAQIRVRIPKDSSLPKLRKEIEAIAADLMIEIKFDQVT